MYNDDLKTLLTGLSYLETLFTNLNQYLFAINYFHFNLCPLINLITENHVTEKLGTKKVFKINHCLTDIENPFL